MLRTVLDDEPGTNANTARDRNDDL